MERAVQLGQERQVLEPMKSAALENPLDVLDPGIGHFDVAPVLVGVVVDAGDERRDQLRQTRRARHVPVEAAGDHQRDARLVDHQRIRFVHEREMERPVHQIGGLRREEIAQVIEPGFLGGHVGHVRVVRGAPRGGRHPFMHVGDGQTQHSIHRAHPVGVAPGQIVVERQDVHAPIGHGVERRRHHRRERLPLPRQHLDHGAGVQRQRGDDLLVEGTLPQHPMGRFARQGEHGHAQRAGRFARAGPGAQFPAAAEDVLIRKLPGCALDRGDFGQGRFIAAQIDTNRRSLKTAEEMFPAATVRHAAFRNGCCLHESPSAGRRPGRDLEVTPSPRHAPDQMRARLRRVSAAHGRDGPGRSCPVRSDRCRVFGKSGDGRYARGRDGGARDEASDRSGTGCSSQGATTAWAATGVSSGSRTQSGSNNA